MISRDHDLLKKQFSSQQSFQFWAAKNRSRSAQYPWGSGVWRWRDLLLPGFPLEHALSLHEGNTDMWEIPDWLKKQIGLKRLFIKQEGQAPSGSFKDRGMPFAISEALRLQAVYPQLNIRFVICASTGDTSASAAIFTAYVRDRLNCIVLIPHGNISLGQLYQVEDAGAIVLALQSEFDTCMRVVQDFCTRHPENVLVNSKNPLRIAGQESISLEIFEDLGWQVPDWLVIPIGNAGNGSAQMNAWLLLKQLGIINHLPGIIFAQTKTANTIVRWIRSGFTEYQPGEPGTTAASAMNIQNPVSKPRIDYFRRHFKVEGYDVAEDQIARTRAQFNRAGANLCPQGAVALNATLQAKEEGIIKENDLVVALATAQNLKFVRPGVDHHSTASAKDFANQPIVIPAEVGAVEAAIEKAVASFV